MKKILLAILATLFTQTFADTPEEWIARANGVIKKRNPCLEQLHTLCLFPR